MGVQYDDPRPIVGLRGSQRSLDCRCSRHQGQMSQQSVSEYAQS